MYGCESWTVKKAERQRIDAFELWYWRRLLSPLDCKEIQPFHSKGDQFWVYFGRNNAKAETPVLWPPHAKSWLTGKDWCWEGLGAGREGDNREWDGWMASLTRWTWVWVNSGSWWWTGRPGVLRFMGSQRVGRDWTELNSVGHSFSSKEQTSFNFMAAVTICCDFGAKRKSLSLFPHLLCHGVMNQMPWSSFSECWPLSQLFHSPLSLSSRGSIVPLCFLS